MATPLHFLVLLATGWLNQELRHALDYVRAENEVLRARLPPSRVVRTNAERRKLASAARVLTPQQRRALATLATPKTLMNWYRRLVANKYGVARPRAPGRPPLKPELVRLILKMAKTTPIHGGHRICGELKKLGHRVSHTTVLKYLREHGIDPEPKRDDTWATFLRAHLGHICAADFFNVEVLTWRGLVRYQVLFVIDLETRLVELAGVVQQAHGEWTTNIFRELTNPIDGFLRHKTHLILDNDPVFTKEARQLLRHAGVSPVKLPPYSPNLNAFAERFIGSMRRELLSRVIPLGEKHLRWLLSEYVAHYNTERPHQGIDNRVIAAQCAANNAPKTKVVCEKRAGGMLVSWARRAA